MKIFVGLAGYMAAMGFILSLFILPFATNSGYRLSAFQDQEWKILSIVTGLFMPALGLGTYALFRKLFLYSSK